MQFCIISLGAVNSLDSDPIKGANIESEAGKDRNPIAWRLKRKGCILVRGCIIVLLHGPPIHHSSQLLSQDSPICQLYARMCLPWRRTKCLETVRKCRSPTNCQTFPLQLPS